MTIVLYRNAFKEVDVFESIAVNLGLDEKCTSIVLNMEDLKKALVQSSTSMKKDFNNENK